ncbi:hypothetical protein HDU76_000685 [Blyttiomyces sp. JEL0837]|nr:hypothetical protein HDU76_000685 [Blyttiomyces sp. JEL0837]
MALSIFVFSIFAITASSVIAAPAIQKDGDITYSQIVLRASGLVVDFPTINNQPAPPKTQLQLNTTTLSDTQLFAFIPTYKYYNNDNSFFIKHLRTGYCVETSGTKTGNAITLNACSYESAVPVPSFSNQIWSVNPSNGGYLIVNMGSNRCLSDGNVGHNFFDPISLVDCNVNSVDMIWNIDTAAIGKFWSQIRSTYNFNTVLFNATSSTWLQIGQNAFSPSTAFRLEPTTDGLYTIINEATGSCLQVVRDPTLPAGSTVPVQILQCTGQDNQKWIIKTFEFDADGVTVWIQNLNGWCLTDIANNFLVGDSVGMLGCNPNSDIYKWHIDYAAFPNKNVVRSPGSMGLTNVEITLLLWGNVTNADKYPDFYQTLLQDPVFEMLGQYGIGAGSYKGSMQLPPVGGPALPEIADVSNYLKNLTQLGYLKPNKNTYYAVHFAPNVVGISCRYYCAVHFSYPIGDLPNQETDKLILGVMPDLTENDCSCAGPFNNVFEAQTMTAAHELFEAVTDPASGGLRDVVTDAEIADICAFKKFSITGSNGDSYVIQRMWSNVARACTSYVFLEKPMIPSAAAARNISNESTTPAQYSDVDVNAMADSPPIDPHMETEIQRAIKQLKKYRQDIDRAQKQNKQKQEHQKQQKDQIQIQTSSSQASPIQMQLHASSTAPRKRTPKKKSMADDETVTKHASFHPNRQTQAPLNQTNFNAQPILAASATSQIIHPQSAMLNQHEQQQVLQLQQEQHHPQQQKQPSFPQTHTQQQQHQPSHINQHRILTLQSQISIIDTKIMKLQSTLHQIEKRLSSSIEFLESKQNQYASILDKLTAEGITLMEEEKRTFGFTKFYDDILKRSRENADRGKLQFQEVCKEMEELKALREVWIRERDALM